MPKTQSRKSRDGGNKSWEMLKKKETVWKILQVNKLIGNRWVSWLPECLSHSLARSFPLVLLNQEEKGGGSDCYQHSLKASSCDVWGSFKTMPRQVLHVFWFHSKSVQLLDRPACLPVSQNMQYNKKTHNMEILDYWGTEVLHWGKEKLITNYILTTNAAFYLPFFLVIGKQVLFKLKQQWELWLEKKSLFLELFFLIEIGQLNFMSLHCKVFIVPLKVP